MRKGDLLIIVFIAIIAVSWVFMTKSGSVAAIYVDGELRDTVPLSKDTQIEIESEYGKNTIVIKDGKVSITNSDCPNKDCEKGSISKASRSLICLPNRLTVIIEGEKTKDETDVVL